MGPDLWSGYGILRLYYVASFVLRCAVFGVCGYVCIRVHGVCASHVAIVVGACASHG